MEANKITIAMLMKLFATNIEASNFLGFFKSSMIISKDFDLYFFASSKSFWLNEKRATSAPEIRAEPINNIIKPDVKLNLFIIRKNGMKKEIQVNGIIFLIMGNIKRDISVYRITEVIYGSEILK